MEDNGKLMESLVESAIEYGKTSFEVIKLQTLDKTAHVASNFVPHSFVAIMVATFLLFVNLGLAVWLGEILGKFYYGFFVVAALYGIIGLIVHFFMHKWLRRVLNNYIIKQVMK